MKIAQGVYLHLIKNQKFKSNHITFRFSSKLESETAARRVLVAQMLAAANAVYPTVQQFREKLASLYGASLSTKVSVKGLVHIVDIDLSFVKDVYSLTKRSLLEEMLDFLGTSLFAPLVSVAQYQSKVFDVEKKNLIHYLKADEEDPLYSSFIGLKKIFFDHPDLQISHYSQPDLLAEETAFTAYQEFQKMLKEDILDIFILGEFEEYRMIQLINKFPLESRQKDLIFSYQQTYRNITQEEIGKRSVKQSVLQLGYHLPIQYNELSYFSVLVLEGILGGFDHSKLFTEVREKAGLAYNIGSQLDIYTGLLNIYAGIDKVNRDQTLKIINKQFSDLRMGRFSSSIIRKTKLMLTESVKLSEDDAKTIIERSYNRHHLNLTNCIEDIVNNIANVSKEDIVNTASQVRLQAVYFLEGE
ncbi:insulinase family protein [Streptococcus chenjunshii]|uniref:Insulinase family protein n=1 Tax=Streptococcus chenjunshii TaxID=2173853 RepID=A0A372KLB9_9STRE|nr:pitrilysin family protein [Streptococcus chenjunshii]AXQ79661.1 insulinase family protein [Streptococcus chenjunshii]RFU51024.1 insulinase family protein [Streptococcus chenjunshii]RFU53067.1 insulinase family protein [Streptococcus chenjunshii]